MSFVSLLRRLWLLSLVPVAAWAQTNTFPSSGNVGIGTTSPGNRLTINTSSGGSGYGGTDGTGGVRVAWSTGYGVSMDAWDASSPHWGIVKFSSNTPTVVMEGSYGSNDVVFNAGGNVGVGITNPSDRLVVRGYYSNAASEFGNTSGGVNYLMSYDRVASAFKPFEFFTGSSPILHLDTSGNVGIGTTTPASPLQINGSSARGQLSFSNNALTSSIAGIGVEGSAGQIVTGSAAGDFSIWSNTSGKINFSANGGAAAQMVLASSGNVGIGTTNPTQKLSVNGTIQAKEVIVQTGWSDYVFKSDYKLASLDEVEAAIQRDGHLPGIPSAQEVAEHGVTVGEMQSKLLAKIEELTLHVIAQEKRMQKLEAENADLRARGVRP